MIARVVKLTPFVIVQVMGLLDHSSMRIRGIMTHTCSMPKCSVYRWYMHGSA